MSSLNWGVHAGSSHVDKEVHEINSCTSINFVYEYQVRFSSSCMRMTHRRPGEQDMVQNVRILLRRATAYSSSTPRDISPNDHPCQQKKVVKTIYIQQQLVMTHSSNSSAEHLKTSIYLDTCAVIPKAPTIALCHQTSRVPNDNLIGQNVGFIMRRSRNSDR